MDQGSKKKVGIGRGELAALACLALVVLGPTPLSTESLTLTTYYPSPYGVYNELRSTSNSYLAYSGGAVGVGTTGVAGGYKFEVAGNAYVTGPTRIDGQTTINANTSVNADLQANRIGINGAVNNIYGTMLSVTGGNIHVQGNENTTWLRVGTAWSMNGIYSESGPVVVGSQNGQIFMGSGDSQYIAQACQSVYYAFGSDTTCPNGGVGWSAIGTSGSAGIINYTMPTAGYMYCCKLGSQ